MHIGGAGFREGNNAVEVVIDYDEDPVPVLSATATDITIQVPWATARTVMCFGWKHTPLRRSNWNRDR